MVNKDFETLLQGSNVDDLKGLMTNNQTRIKKALSFYRPEEHKISKNPKKRRVGNEFIDNWPIALPIQKTIVRNTVAFLVGKPVRLVQQSEGTDRAYTAVQEVWDEMRMNSKLFDLLEKFYSETEAVIMFRPYRDRNADPMDFTKPNTIRCKVLSKSDGYDIYYIFDEFGTLKAWGRDFKVKIDTKNEIRYFEVETPEVIVTYKKTDNGWDRTEVPNVTGKINMVLFTQETWDSYDVDYLIERREVLTSSKAKNNDAMGNPILKITGEVKNLPDIEKSVKVVQMDEGADAEYLYPQMSVDLIKEEREDLKDLINYFTSTPDYSMETMRSIGTTSGKAIELMFFPTILKATKNIIVIEELFDRMMAVIKNMLAKINVNDTELVNQLDKLRIKFEFTSPLPQNVADLVEMLSTATGGKATLSQQEAAVLNPLTRDGQKNWELLKSEQISEEIE